MVGQPAFIETDRFYLRPLVGSDAAAFQRLTDDPSIIDAIDFLRAPFTLADAQALISGNDAANCFRGVWHKLDNDLLGTIGAHLRGREEIEIGYWFAPSARGRGFALEAAAAVVDAMKAEHPERRLYAECRPQNAASWRLLEKLGFRADGEDGQRRGRKRLVRAS